MGTVYVELICVYRTFDRASMEVKCVNYDGQVCDMVEDKSAGGVVILWRTSLFKYSWLLSNYVNKSEQGLDQLSIALDGGQEDHCVWHGGRLISDVVSYVHSNQLRL